MVNSRVSINEKLKLVQFWLTNEEDIETPNIAEKIEALFLLYKADSKYRKIIYHSGKKDLTAMTTGLIIQNQKA